MSVQSSKGPIARPSSDTASALTHRSSFRDEPTVRFLTLTLTCFSASQSDIGEDLARAILSRVPTDDTSVPDVPLRKLAPLTIRIGESG